VQISDFVFGAQRYDRQQCEADDRHRCHLVDGRSTAILGCLFRRSARSRVPGGTPGSSPQHWIDGAQAARPTLFPAGQRTPRRRTHPGKRSHRRTPSKSHSPAGPQGRCERERRCECEENAPDRHHPPFGVAPIAVRSAVWPDDRAHAEPRGRNLPARPARLSSSS
jgi:hypothetical protein